MALLSLIEWTDATWNPWQGCTKVSPACEHCYMFSDLRRYGRDPTVVVKSTDPTFFLPLKRRRSGEYALPPGSKVFACSWSDWFHERADPWRPKAWSIIKWRPDVIFQIVTKRTERIAECLPPDWGDGWPNVWLIATVENQHWANIRVPQLLGVPAAVRGLSIEPMLGEIRIPQSAIRNLSWVIAGGESGPHARPSHPEWFRSLRDQCQAAGVAFFFKQWGEWAPFFKREDGTCPVRIDADHYGAWLDGEWYPGFLSPKPGPRMLRVGKKAAGRLLDGREWNEFPQVRAEEPASQGPGVRSQGP